MCNVACYIYLGRGGGGALGTCYIYMWVEEVEAL